MLDAFYTRTPLIFGHRGASAYAPMNTLPAFELAAVLGADGIELDVHRTRDGHLAIIHDFEVDATTDGEGRVTEKTLAELKALDAGAWFGETFIGTRIPTLDEVFETVGDRLLINVEIKSEDQMTDGVEKAVADCITRHAMHQRVIVSSFNPLALARFRGVLPDVPIGFLYALDMPIDTRVILNDLSLTHEARHPHHTMIDAPYMAWAREVGSRVNTWTVNDPAEAVRLARLGVDAIITDRPDTIREAVRGA